MISNYVSLKAETDLETLCTCLTGGPKNMYRIERKYGLILDVRGNREIMVCSYVKVSVKSIVILQPLVELI